MRGKAISAGLFGALAVLFGYLLFRSFDPGRVHFLPDHLPFTWRDRLYETSFDRLVPLALLTTICIVVAVRSLVGMRSVQTESVSPSESPVLKESVLTWVCSGCGEVNPDNFEECWKCQKPRVSG